LLFSLGMNADVFDYPIISAGLMIFVCLDSYKMYLAKTGGDGLPVTSHQEAQNLVSAKFLCLVIPVLLY
jgi:hypothetical protein